LQGVCNPPKLLFYFRKHFIAVFKCGLKFIQSKILNPVPDVKSVPSPLGDFGGLSPPKKYQDPPNLKYETL